MSAPVYMWARFRAKPKMAGTGDEVRAKAGELLNTANAVQCWQFAPGTVVLRTAQTSRAGEEPLGWIYAVTRITAYGDTGLTSADWTPLGLDADAELTEIVRGEPMREPEEWRGVGRTWR